MASQTSFIPRRRAQALQQTIRAENRAGAVRVVQRARARQHEPYIKVSPVELNDSARGVADRLLSTARRGEPVVKTTTVGAPANPNITKHTIQCQTDLNDLKGIIRRLFVPLRTAVFVQLTFEMLTARRIPEDDNRLDIARGYVATPFFNARTRPVHNEHQLNALLHELTLDAIIERCWARPNSQTFVLGIFACTLTFTHRTQVMRDGEATLPPVLNASRSVITWQSCAKGLCAFYHLAWALAVQADPTHRYVSTAHYTARARTLYEQFRGVPYDPENVVPLATEELHTAATRFGVHTLLWHYDGTQDGKVQMHVHTRPVATEGYTNALLVGAHVCTITSANALLATYHCRVCDTAFDRLDNLHRHEAMCTEAEPPTIPPASYPFGGMRSAVKPRLNVLDEIALKYGVPLNYALRGLLEGQDVPKDEFLPTGRYNYARADTHVPDFLFWDIESEPVPEDERAAAGKTLYLNTQRGVCVSVASSLDADGTKKTFMADDYGDDLTAMWRAFFEYARTLADAIALATRLRVYLWHNKVCEVMALKEQDMQKRARDAQPKDKGFWGRTLDGLRKRQKADKDKMEGYLFRVPLVGFNTGSYDVPTSVADGFLSGLLAYERSTGAEGSPVVGKPIPKGTYGFKKLETKHFVLLDISCYLGAGTKLADFQKTYLPPTDDQRKQVFPYSVLADYVAFCRRTHPFTEEEFNRSLRLKNETATPDLLACNDAQWATAVRQNPAQPAKQYLKNYCEADVVPTIKAVKAFVQSWWNDGISIFKEGVGIASISELMLVRSIYQPLREANPYDLPAPAGAYVPLTHADALGRAEGYIKQDCARAVKEAQPEPKPETPCAAVMADICVAVHARQQGVCLYCHKTCTDDWSLERINCKRNHTLENCALACVACNTARKHSPATQFWLRKAIERHATTTPTLHVLGRDGEEEGGARTQFVQRLRKVVGGFSGTLHRHARVGDRRAPLLEWNPHIRRFQNKGGHGAPIRLIGCLDVKSMYPYVMASFGSPCGQGTLLTPQTPEDTTALLARVRAGTFCGFVVCDVRVPEHRYGHYSIWPPCFKNREVCYDEQSPTTQAVMQALEMPTTWKERKTIQCMTLEDEAVASPLLRWYLEQGFEVSAVKQAMEFQDGSPIKAFVDTLASRRLEQQRLEKEAERAGDLTRASAHKAESDRIKTCMNSLYGRLLMNPAKYAGGSQHITMDCADVFKRVNRKQFRSLSALKAGDETWFHIQNDKNRIVEYVPVAAGNWVLQCAKLVLNEFIYGFLVPNLGHDRFQVIATDTDSLICAFAHPDALPAHAADQLRSYVLPDRLAAYDREAPERLVPQVYDQGKWKEAGGKIGQFNLEWRGVEAVALNAKVYSLDGKKPKMTSKGSQERNKKPLAGEDVPRVCHQSYLDVVYGRVERVEVVNTGFRVVHTAPDRRVMKTYQTTKTGLTPLYTKAWVCPDGITLHPFLN